MLINKTNIAKLAIASALWSQIAAAGVVEVKAVVTKFEPTVAFIKPGDSVKFTNMAGHDTVAIEGMIPQGAKPWKSAMGEEITIALDKEGAYVYKCTPHVGTGMLGAIVVGKVPPANLDAIKKSPENKGMVGRAVRQLEKEVEAHK
jgi:pseudoazurin